MTEQTGNHSALELEQRPFNIPVKKIGTAVLGQPGELLGLPLTGPGDADFIAEMKEIRQMEQRAWQDTRNIRL